MRKINQRTFSQYQYNGSNGWNGGGYQYNMPSHPMSNANNMSGEEEEEESEEETLPVAPSKIRWHVKIHRHK